MTAQKGAEGDHVERVRNFLGLLLAGFVGALNLIGLSSNELTTVMRNDALRASFVGFLLFAALATAMTSVFITNSRRTRPLRALGIITLTSSIAPLSIYAVQIPEVTTDIRVRVSLGATFTIALTGLILLVVDWRKNQKTTWPLEAVYLACAVLLTSTSIYTAARLEAKSQLDATYPQVGASIKTDGSTGEVSALVSASKLSKGNKIGVLIRGVPRKFPWESKCDDKAVGSCFKEVCKTYPKGPCEHVISGALEPDSAGVVKDQLVSAPFSLSAYRLLEVRATICETDHSAVTAMHPNPNKKECRYKHKATLLFLSIPSTNHQ